MKLLGTIVLSVVAMLGSVVLVTVLPSLIYQKDYIFYTVNGTSYFIAMTMGYVLIGYFLIRYKYVNQKQLESEQSAFSDYEAAYDFIQPIWEKSKYIVPICVVIGIYVACTQVVFVTPDEVFVVKPLAPLGTSYAYTDVKEVKIYSPFYKRDLNYDITFNDGTKVNLNDGGGDDINTDTYVSLQEFDRVVVKLGAKKSSDLDAVYKYTKDYDRVYHERWMNIAQNGLKE